MLSKTVHKQCSFIHFNCSQLRRRLHYCSCIATAMTDQCCLCCLLGKILSRMFISSTMFMTVPLPNVMMPLKLQMPLLGWQLEVRAQSWHGLHLQWHHALLAPAVKSWLTWVPSWPKTASVQACDPYSSDLHSIHPWLSAGWTHRGLADCTIKVEDCSVELQLVQ